MHSQDTDLRPTSYHYSELPIIPISNGKAGHVNGSVAVEVQVGRAGIRRQLRNRCHRWRWSWPHYNTTTTKNEQNLCNKLFFQGSRRMQRSICWTLSVTFTMSWLFGVSEWTGINVPFIPFLFHSIGLACIAMLMMSHSLIHLPPAQCSPLSPSITHSLFHSRLKTHLFHKSYPYSVLAPTGLPSWTILDRIYSAQLFSFLVIFLSDYGSSTVHISDTNQHLLTYLFTYSLQILLLCNTATTPSFTGLWWIRTLFEDNTCLSLSVLTAIFQVNLG